MRSNFQFEAFHSAFCVCAPCVLCLCDCRLCQWQWEKHNVALQPTSGSTIGGHGLLCVQADILPNHYHSCTGNIPAQEFRRTHSPFQLVYSYNILTPSHVKLWLLCPWKCFFWTLLYKYIVFLNGLLAQLNYSTHNHWVPGLGNGIIVWQVQ